ncbi:MAG TPA: DUF1223 domain-containing protein, partial [Acidobacteriaceae bacterium]|nr:DUF1223 domain-containing protein [Acidobacteriaceae bacterium]
MRLRHLLATSAVLIAAHPELRAGPPLASSHANPASVVIVELFTSEGCSSCPPADSLLRQVHLKKTSAGQLIVGISEHVTYWDHLGWKDPYSAQVFTDRQSVYASHLSPEGPYTPQMIVDGHNQFVGGNGDALQRALQDDARRTHFDLQIVSSVLSSKRLDVTFSFSGKVASPLDVVAVLTDDVDQSNVSQGENRGRLLEHVSVARSLARVATVTGDTRKSFHLSIPDDFESGRGHHLVVFAQQPHQG